MANISLPPPGALPMYLRVSEVLAREIRAGRLPDGSKLPTERQLADEFGIAVGTLRKALAALEENGLVSRVQGSGNYVRMTHDPQSIYALFRLELLKGGGLPTADMLSLKTLIKPDDAPDFGPTATAHQFRRVRFLDDTPVALEEIWLDEARAPAVTMRDVSESLYYYYSSVLNVFVGHCVDRLSVAHMPDWVDARLAVEPGACCGYIERVTFDQAGDPFEFSRTWYDHTQAQYVSWLK